MEACKTVELPEGVTQVSQYKSTQHSVQIYPTLSTNLPNTQYISTQHSAQTCPRLSTNIPRTQYTSQYTAFGSVSSYCTDRAYRPTKASTDPRVSSYQLEIRIGIHSGPVSPLLAYA
eukprot:3027860-Rhodomonas_salina.1